MTLPDTTCFGLHGVCPAGQKRIGFYENSVLHQGLSLLLCINEADLQQPRPVARIGKHPVQFIDQALSDDIIP